MTSSKDLRIAIVGGGIVGVACAVRLQRAGLKVDLFESASKFGEVGAGVGFGPNAIRALKGLGVYDAMMARTGEELNMEPFQYISEQEGHELVYDQPIGSGDVDVGMTIHRAVFLDAVVGLLDAERTHFSKRLDRITQSEELGHTVSTLHFQDGTTFEADVVIGADGIRSATRVAVAEHSTRATWSNTVAYRGLIPSEHIREVNLKTDLFRGKPTNILGDNRHLIIFPVSNNEIVNVVIFCTDRSKPAGSVDVPVQDWTIPVEKQEIFDAFKGCGSDVHKIISLLKDPRRWAIHLLDPTLSSFVRDNIALVGDAAHGMCPHLGSGAGQGFEDALVICELLLDPRTNVSNVQDVFKAYDEIRRPRANKVLKASTAAGDLYETWRDVPIDELKTRLHDMWGWIWYHDLQGDILSTERSLEERGVWRASESV
ncbi:FAD/NAD(P)-binding domain-containing protein [Coniophora puteana RWD-64-598 SS2]|uniref:FAD/NAD(P)-binding domain-containing protein n=1 Tax=Coniophora puteana (strain RWD-64-598) TaxID=741705 RepID=A0A5M3MXT6_CONPW|nr:FAD/NAD(P)-binding domain-containing protein [Coniophora puteana RWD-64-598 SS2]EIW83983.1 FAD/NAD(P)-binding domain-containing protein [Coniophora puteana RWD-64-598 SS2]